MKIKLNRSYYCPIKEVKKYVTYLCSVYLLFLVRDWNQLIIASEHRNDRMDRSFIHIIIPGSATLERQCHSFAMTLPVLVKLVIQQLNAKNQYHQ